MFKELKKLVPQGAERKPLSTKRTGSYRELIDLELEDIKTLYMKAYGYDYDHALDHVPGTKPGGLYQC
jgi:hypothetical protein